MKTMLLTQQRQQRNGKSKGNPNSQGGPAPTQNSPPLPIWKSIIHELTCINTSQQNGVAERKNCHLLEDVRILLSNVYSKCLLRRSCPNYHLPRKQATYSCLTRCVTFVHSHSPIVDVQHTNHENNKDYNKTEGEDHREAKGEDHNEHRSFIATIDAIKIPTSIHEAMKDRNWVQAIREEIKELERNSTWDIVDKPKDKRVIDLEAKVYVEITPGFETHGIKNKVCKLKKALYGLKQYPRAWFGRFTQVMISLEYKQSQDDHTLLIKHSLDGKLTLLLVYVDDMIIASDDEI
ncbi:hypothetical protein CR513_24332, partial [Mucuna pruriens]